MPVDNALEMWYYIIYNTYYLYMFYGLVWMYEIFAVC